MFGGKRILSLETELNKVAANRDMYKARCENLENNIEKDFAVKIRQEITEIKIDFSLMELTIMHLAICNLMERPLTTEDATYYLDLRIKLENLMTQVKE